MRCVSAVDAEAIAFEQKLLESGRSRPHEPETKLRVDMPLFQQTAWLKTLGEQFRLFQLSDSAGAPAAQIAAEIHVPRRAKWFRHATVASLGNAFTSNAAQSIAIEKLSAHLRSEGVCRLRIQISRPRVEDRMDFESIARRAGFKLVEPMGVWRTLLCDLKSSEEELLAHFSKSTRTKFRHKGSDRVEIVDLADSKWIAPLEKTLNAAFARTGGGNSHTNLDALFAVARARPDLVLIQGLFFKDRPAEMLACQIGVRHGDVAEWLCLGSMPDAELRKMPFNFFLFWKFQGWARSHGVRHLDLGGVTDGAPGDPLAGISSFKRHFTGFETEIGREMEISLSPVACALFDLAAQIKAWLARI
jgi:hypothetical protein